MVFNSDQAKIESVDGFTLIEVMIALVLFSMIFVSTYSAISLATKTKTAVERRGEVIRAGTAFLMRLERELTSAVVFPATKGGRSGSIFRGVDNDESVVARDGLVFTCSCFELWTQGLEDANTVPQVEVAYDFTYDNESESTLLERRQDNTLDDDPTSGGFSEFLWPYIRGLNLRFLDPVDKVWKNAWDSDARKRAPLPQAVEVTLWLADVEQDGDELSRPFILGKTILIPTVFPER